jgi:hypothetical protein
MPQQTKINKYANTGTHQLAIDIIVLIKKWYKYGHKTFYRENG